MKIEEADEFLSDLLFYFIQEMHSFQEMCEKDYEVSRAEWIKKFIAHLKNSA